MSTPTCAFALIFPVTIRGRRITFLDLRAPDERDVAWAQRQRGSDVRKAMTLFARLCDVKLAVIRALDDVDITRLDLLVEQMFRLQIAELRKLRGA